MKSDVGKLVHKGFLGAIVNAAYGKVASNLFIIDTVDGDVAPECWSKGADSLQLNALARVK